MKHGSNTESIPGYFEKSMNLPPAPNLDGAAIQEWANRIRDLRDKTMAEIAKVVVGMDEVTHQFLIALLAAGHVLLEGVDMATLSCPIETEEEFLSRDVVKVVTAVDGDALYFSRAPIPFGSRAIAQRHIGLYGYRTPVLRSLAMLPPSPLERAESLEQLRALQNGFKIRVVQTDKPHLGVDRPEDVARVESELAKHA